MNTHFPASSIDFDCESLEMLRVSRDQSDAIPGFCEKSARI